MSSTSRTRHRPIPAPRRGAFLVALATLLLPSLARAGSDEVGTTAANFLTIGSGTGILGMGGTTLGLPGDLNAAAWNAASLGWIKENEVVFSHAQLPDQTSQEWFSTGGRIAPTELRWAITALYQSLGSAEGRDASNNPTGSLHLASMAFGAQFARPIGEHVSVGFGAKWVNEDLSVVRGSGVTFEGGVQARKGIFGFGAAAQNAFGKMTYQGLKYDFPTNWGVGVGIDDENTGLRVGLDLNVPTAYYTNVRGGVEWRWKQYVALRAGYRSELGAPPGESLSGPTFGMGGGAYGLWFDYGYLLSTESEGQHRIGLTWHPGKLNWISGDPFGQRDMPREFGEPGTLIGPPPPPSESSKPKKKS